MFPLPLKAPAVSSSPLCSLYSAITPASRSGARWLVTTARSWKSRSRDEINDSRETGTFWVPAEMRRSPGPAPTVTPA